MEELNISPKRINTMDGKIDLEIVNRVKKATKTHYAIYKPIFEKREVMKKK